MGDGQTQAGAGTAAGLVGPVEGVPHVGQRLVGQGRTVVFHGEPGLAPLPAYFHRNPALLGRVLDGITGEILHHLGQAALVGHDGTGRGEPEVDPEALGLRGGLQLLKDGPGQIRQREFVPGELYLARLQPGQVQQLHDHGVGPLGLGQNDVQILLSLFLGHPGLEALGIAVDHRQRRFQFMGNIGGHLPPVGLGFLRIVQRLLQPGQFVFLLAQSRLPGKEALPEHLGLPPRLGQQLDGPVRLHHGAGLLHRSDQIPPEDGPHD